MAHGKGCDVSISTAANNVEKRKGGEVGGTGRGVEGVRASDGDGEQW